ncbi:hypothetical protein [Gracilimonas tropica]|uniref:hypothetical protein n=1 Tax=Gracilimonas tropica TaxID=454600 RepID=UPI000367934C|nr:hypothetical protein [Gracilimonas tropica]
MPIRTEPLTDTSPCPVPGRYEGTLMANVPAGYLLTIRDTDWIRDWPDVKDWIEDNIELLNRELKATVERKLKHIGQ